MNKQNNSRYGKAALALIGWAATGAAFADMAPVRAYAAAADTSLPSNFGLLLWLPLVALPLCCIAGLVWLIISDRVKADDRPVANLETGTRLTGRISLSH